jgi:outer membrane immunogenic protein
MKVLSRVSSLLAGTAVLAGAAVAGAGLAQADAYQRGAKVAYQAPFNWGGFYFGVHSGWQWSDINSSFGNTGNPALQIVGVNGTGWSVEHDSPVVGGQIGLQHQFGHLVLGVEGSYTTAYRDNYGSTLCPRQTIALFDCVARFDDVLTIGGRLGWAMTTDCCKHFMPYLTAGYATMEWSAEGRNRSLAPGAFTIIQWGDGRNTGWYVGAGVDWALAQGWTLGIEYRHYDFDTNLELARAVVGGVWGAVPNDNASFDMSADTVTLRVSWKLGRPERVVPLK